MASKVPDGTYRIVSAVPDPDGSRLAFEYRGYGIPVVVEKEQDIPSQKWLLRTIATPSQSIIPNGERTLYLIPAEGNVVTISSFFNWWVTEDQEGATIEVFQRTAVLGLQEAVVGAPVSLRPNTGEEKNKWRFIPTSAA